MQKSLNPISSNNKNYNNYARTAKTFYKQQQATINEFML